MRYPLVLCLVLLPLVLFVERDTGVARGTVQPARSTAASARGPTENLTPVNARSLTPVNAGGLTPVNAEGLIPASAGSLTPANAGRKELQRFIDRFFAAHMKTYHLPGAVFVLVKDGKIFFAKGYGYANRAKRTPVVPARTVFRLCSVSKVFTATAVLQLAEQKRVRLDADANRYLTRFQLPAGFSRPVTLADLLQHTGGFEERHIGRSTLDATSLRPLGPFLADLLPSRVAPPGQVYSYSDFGYSLAGYVVEARSGLPFARYVERRIFRPLAMHQSSFQQRLPPGLKANLATGYDVGDDGALHPAPLEYLNTAPAAGMMATATDVAHFMIAQLQEGRFKSSRILGANTIREMQRQHFSSYPPGYLTPGVTYGFDLSYWNGRRILEHAGALRGFSSLLVLLPTQKLGFFIAGNTSRDAYLFDLKRRFMDHYFPVRTKSVRLRSPKDLQGDLDRFTGSYWSTEYSHHTIEKLRQLLNQVQVTAGGNRTLIAHFWDGRTVRVTRLAPLLFGRIDDQNITYWAFQQDAEGQITRMIPGGNEVYDKIDWYATTRIQTEFIAAVALTFLSGCLVWLLLPLLRPRWRAGGREPRRRRPGSQRVPRVPRRRSQTRCGGCPGCRPTRGRGPGLRCTRLAGWLLGLTSALNLFFLVTLLLLMLSAASTQGQHYSWIEYGVPPAVIVLLCIPLLTTGLTAVLIALAVLAWRNRYWSLLRRLHYTGVTLGALAFVPFLLYWNLLGFHF